MSPIDHKSSLELYTKCLILSKVELGDSLSDIQRKTKMSFTTVQKTVKVLEKKKVIKIKENITDRGRAKECVDLSQNHKEAAIFYLDLADKMSSFLSNRNDSNPILFEMEILRECLNKIRGEFSKNTMDIFNEWLKSNDGKVDTGSKEFKNDFYEIKDEITNFFPDDFEIKVKTIKKEDKSTKKVTLDRFM